MDSQLHSPPSTPARHSCVVFSLCFKEPEAPLRDAVETAFRSFDGSVLGQPFNCVNRGSNPFLTTVRALESLEIM